MPKKLDLIAKRATLLDDMQKMLDRAPPSGADEKALKAFRADVDKDFAAAEAEVVDLGAQIDRLERHEKAMAASAVPAGGQEDGTRRAGTGKAAASPKTDDYEKDPSLVVGGMIKMLAMAKGSVIHAADYATGIYGENHPVAQAMQESKALSTLVGASGGFVVPPDFVDEMIPLFYVVVERPTKTTKYGGFRITFPSRVAKTVVASFPLITVLSPAFPSLPYDMSATRRGRLEITKW